MTQEEFDSLKPGDKVVYNKRHKSTLRRKFIFKDKNMALVAIDNNILGNLFLADNKTLDFLEENETDNRMDAPKI